MQTEQKMFVTAEGLEKLKAELSDLKDRGRREIAERIKIAKEYGDLSENAEYQTAKEQQAFTEGRIAEIEEVLRHAAVIEKSKGASSTVTVGSTVVVKINGDDAKFSIVGSHEADPAQGKISNQSPLGQALLDKKVGEKVAVEAPVGTITYTIKKIL